MKAADPKVVTSVTLPPALRAELDAEAAAQDRSRSWVTAAAIRAYLAARRAEAAQPESDAPC